MQGLLQLREAHPGLFALGSYEPATASGAFTDRVVAFRRSHGGEQLLVVVPRLSAEIGTPPLGVSWDDTTLGGVSGERWVDVFNGHPFTVKNGALALSELLAEAPFAVLLAGSAR
jgi:(1->4)-alpha-D-glucan 1-alpha-D-glucosylmutase